MCSSPDSSKGSTCPRFVSVSYRTSALACQAATDTAFRDVRTNSAADERALRSGTPLPSKNDLCVQGVAQGRVGQRGTGLEAGERDSPAANAPPAQTRAQRRPARTSGLEACQG
jgi:hypothetical protein